MAQVVYSRNALRNLERALAYVVEVAPGAELRAVRAIQSGVGQLAKHPFMGRPIAGGMRELVISYGKTGYVALYRFVLARNVVRILALRHQRELDYDLQ